MGLMNLLFLLSVFATFTRGQGPRGQSQEGDYCQTIQPRGILRRCAPGLRCVDNRCTRIEKSEEDGLALLSALLNENENSFEVALAQGPRGHSQEGDYCQTIQPHGMASCAPGLGCVDNKCTRYTSEADLAHNWPDLREAALSQGPRGHSQEGDYCQTIQPHGMASCAPGLRCVDNKCTRYTSETDLAHNWPDLREAALSQGPLGQSQEGDYCQTIQPRGILRRCAPGLRCVDNRCTRIEKSEEHALSLLSALLNENENSLEIALAEAETSGSWLYDTNILFENRLHRPIFVKGECNFQALSKETKRLSGKLQGEYNGNKGSLELKHSVSRKFEYDIKKAKFTKIPANSDWTGHYPKFMNKNEGCQPVYVSLYVEMADGTIELIQDSGQAENGKSMIIKGTPKNPTINSGGTICHGPYKDCGCWNGYCMTKCGFWLAIMGKNSKDWCYSTKGAKNDRKWVRCQHDKHCRPNWECGGHCSVGW